MNRRRVEENDYIEFLLAAQGAFSCTEASRTSPEAMQSVAHDAYTRLLTRRPLDPGALWNEAQCVGGQAVFSGGLLVLDDTTLDKPYAQNISLVSRHWSGKHHKVVWGINLLSLVWTQLGAPAPVVPLDFRVSDPDADQNGQHFTKNDHFRSMVSAAKTRGLSPECIAFDSWYAGLDNLKHVRREGFHFLTRLKSNRLVNPDKSGLVEVASLWVQEVGKTVWLKGWLKGFGLVRVFQKADAKGEVEHWATSDLEMTNDRWHQWAKACWSIESYHRGLKGCCGAERAQVRSATGQKNHLLLCLRAFLRLEARRLQTALSWYESKRFIIRGAIQIARSQQQWTLSPTA